MANRNWDKTLFSKFEHVASPSQLVDYLDCPRKWWFRRCVKLPEIADQTKFTFGNVLHGVTERWLKADDNGRGPDGKPVNLYPEGWAESLSPADQALIRKLVDLAISSGMLRRLPGRQIEKEYQRIVVDGVVSIGALDITSPEGVEDQKSTKDPRYIASQQELASDPKMLSYAYEWLMDTRKDGVLPSQVKLRLNYFIKNPEAPGVKHVEVLVPTPKILEFWEKTVKPAHQGMLDLKRAKIADTDWRSVTGPQKKDTCKKYGGCPRAKICAGIQSCATHRAEIERINDSKNNPKPRPKKKTAMGIFNRKPVTPAAQAAASTPPAPAAAKAPETPASAANPTTNAPWAHEGCFACQGKGINKEGNPCKACHTIRKRRGESTVDDYEVWHDDAGNLCWKAADKDKASTPPPAPKVEQTPAQAAEEPEGKAPIAAEPKQKRSARTKKVEPEVKAAPEPTVPAEPERRPFVEVAGSTEGDLAAGFRLFVNATPMGSRNVLDAAALLDREGADMAKAHEVESFYDLDPFKRRDQMARYAAAIAAGLDGTDVVAIGGGQDLKALVEALRPFAREVVQGVF